MNQTDTLIELVRLDIPQVRIRSSKYETPVFSFGVKDTPSPLLKLTTIPRLDEILIPEAQVNYALNFPFSETFQHVIHGGPKGISRRSIIDHVRRAYRQMYRRARAMPCVVITHSRTHSKTRAGFPIGNLFIKSVYYHPQQHYLMVHVDGLPVPVREPEIPF